LILATRIAARRKLALVAKECRALTQAKKVVKEIAHGVKLGPKRKLSDINAPKPSSCLGSGAASLSLM
jgi:hypothetical protein